MPLTNRDQFKNLYNEAVKRHLMKFKKLKLPVPEMQLTILIHELPRLKPGRPLLLWDELVGQVQEYMKELRSC